MLLLPLPFFLAEIFIFFSFVGKFGFFDTFISYLMPSLLGFVVLSLAKRVGLAQLQMTVMSGKTPEKAMLHSGAIFIGGILLVIPLFITRVLAVFLILPGLRHFLIWRLTKNIQKRMAAGAQGFSFGGPFGGMGGFGAGAAGQGGAGFKYYQYRSGAPRSSFEEDVEPEVRQERVIDAEVIDVNPIEITHSVKKDSKEDKAD